MGDYTWAFVIGARLALGFLVIAGIMSALLGRWVTANETWLGMTVRGACVMGVAIIALRHFATVWYWLILPLALLPLADIFLGTSISGAWLMRHKQQVLAEALSDAAANPTHSLIRLALARALLDAGQIEAGLATLDQASALALDDGYPRMGDFVAEAKREFVRYCPHCDHPNPPEARACRHCIRALTDNAALRVWLSLCRPVLLHLHRSAIPQRAKPARRAQSSRVTSPPPSTP